MTHEHGPIGHSAFKVEPNQRAFVCRKVHEGAPILYASHDEDGDWQFLCGGSHEDQDENGGDGPVVKCFACVVASDRSLNDLAPVVHGGWAHRSTAHDPWTLIDPSEEFILKMLEDPGWAVTIVEGDEEGPGFAYTTGLFKNLGAPELIILGLRNEVMHAILNDVAGRAKTGLKLVHEARLDDVIDRFPLALRKVCDPNTYRAYLGYSRWLYGGDGFPVLQVIYPDGEGRFPGEPDAAPGLADQQPLLD